MRKRVVVYVYKENVCFYKARDVFVKNGVCSEDDCEGQVLSDRSFICATDCGWQVLPARRKLGYPLTERSAATHNSGASL